MMQPRCANWQAKLLLAGLAAIIGWHTSLLANEPKPLALHLPFEEIWTCKGPVAITADKPVELAVPTLKRAVGKTVALRFRARVNGFSGWNTFLGIRLNGENVEALNRYGESRLLNRPATFASASGTNVVASGNHYLTFFTSDFDRIDPSVTDPAQRTETTWFVLDINDLVNEDGENVLQLANAYSQAAVEMTSLAVGYVTPMSSPAGKLAAVCFTPTGAVERPAYVVRACADGGLSIVVGNERFYLDATFSYPHAGKDRNALAADDGKSGGEEDWKPTVKIGGCEITVAAQGKHYALARRVLCRDRFLEIHDSLTNRTADVLGVMVRQRVVSERTPAKLRVAGLVASPAFPVAPSRSASNPTLFLGLKQGGLGLFAQDTAFRNQLVMETSGNVALFGTNELGLAPHEAYTLRWRVYPTKDNDYFRFVNRLRADLGANYTILGPAKFLSDIRHKCATVSPEELKRYMDRQYAPLGLLPLWFCYADGADCTPENWLNIIRPAVANLTKGLPPEARLLPCFEICFQPVPKQIKIRQWPADAAKWPTADGFIVDPDGSYSTTKEYTYGKPVVNFRSYVRLGTNYYQKLLAGIDGAMDAGCRGIYFDIFSCEGMRTYDRWDGRTVEIDPENCTVVRKAALLPIIEAPAKKALVEHIVKRGGVVVCNQYPVWEQLQAAPIFSFFEINDLDFSPINKGHLAAPIGLSLSWPPTESSKLHTGADLAAAVIARLKEGGLFYYYHTAIKDTDVATYELVRHMYPITIEELHAGWIKGKERTITCVPGKYAIGGVKTPQVLLFTKDGRRSLAPPSSMQNAGKTEWTVDLSNLPQGGVVIIGRRDE
jgi:hypothetical protein